jgi:hypothetical protein
MVHYLVNILYLLVVVEYVILVLKDRLQIILVMVELNLLNHQLSHKNIMELLLIDIVQVLESYYQSCVK